MAPHRLLEQVEFIGNGAAAMVVAHSMGGAVRTRAAQRRPDQLRRLACSGRMRVVDQAAVSGLQAPKELMPLVPTRSELSGSFPLRTPVRRRMKAREGME